MISFKTIGSFDDFESYLEALVKLDVMDVLDGCGQAGVSALAAATPVRSGVTSESWTYEVTVEGGVYTIAWENTDVHDGFPIAIMLQYGYATGTGGYVQGRDYINPAIEPVFEQIADDVWKAVTSA